MKQRSLTLPAIARAYVIVLVEDYDRSYRYARPLSWLASLALGLWWLCRVGEQMVADLNEWVMVAGEVVDEWAVLINELFGESGMTVWFWLVRLEITAKILWWGWIG